MERLQHHDIGALEAALAIGDHLYIQQQFVQGVLRESNAFSCQYNSEVEVVVAEFFVLGSGVGLTHDKTRPVADEKDSNEV
jgi:hypothetical protein